MTAIPINPKKIAYDSETAQKIIAFKKQAFDLLLSAGKKAIRSTLHNKKTGDVFAKELDPISTVGKSHFKAKQMEIAIMNKMSESLPDFVHDKTWDHYTAQHHSLDRRFVAIRNNVSLSFHYHFSGTWNQFDKVIGAGRIHGTFGIYQCSHMPFDRIRTKVSHCLEYGFAQKKYRLAKNGLNCSNESTHQKQGRRDEERIEESFVYPGIAEDLFSVFLGLKPGHTSLPIESINRLDYLMNVLMTSYQEIQPTIKTIIKMLKDLNITCADWPTLENQ
jgi:hypothetical protein